VEVVASLSQGRTAAAQCGLFTYKSVPVIFEPPCTIKPNSSFFNYINWNSLNVLFIRCVKLCGVTKVQGVHFMPSISLKVLNI